MNPLPRFVLLYAALYAAFGVSLRRSGGLFARLGAQGFWVMAMLCAAALPLAWVLRDARRTA